MNTRPDFRKPCYKCGNMTAVTPEEMHNGQKSTACEACKAKLAVELGAVNWQRPRWGDREVDLDFAKWQPPSPEFPKEEATTSSPPPAVYVP